MFGHALYRVSLLGVNLFTLVVESVQVILSEFFCPFFGGVECVCWWGGRLKLTFAQGVMQTRTAAAFKSENVTFRFQNTISQMSQTQQNNKQK